jgi:hypothetical protein
MNNHTHDNGENCAQCAFKEEVFALAYKGLHVNELDPRQVVATLSIIAMDLCFEAYENPLHAVGFLTYGLNAGIEEMIKTSMEKDQ